MCSLHNGCRGWAQLYHGEGRFVPTVQTCVLAAATWPPWRRAPSTSAACSTSPSTCSNRWRSLRWVKSPLYEEQCNMWLNSYKDILWWAASLPLNRWLDSQKNPFLHPMKTTFCLSSWYYAHVWNQEQPRDCSANCAALIEQSENHRVKDYS